MLDAVTVAHINMSDQTWLERKRDACRAGKDQSPSTFYETISSVVAASTSLVQGPDARYCSFLNNTFDAAGSDGYSQSIWCTYDNFDLKLSVTVLGGTAFLDSLQYEPPSPHMSNYTSPAAGQSDGGANACLITSCGHGQLSESSCTCACETGWEHASVYDSQGYYCSGAYESDAPCFVLCEWFCGKTGQTCTVQ